MKFRLPPQITKLFGMTAPSAPTDAATRNFTAAENQQLTSLLIDVKEITQTTYHMFTALREALPRSGLNPAGLAQAQAAKALIEEIDKLPENPAETLVSVMGTCLSSAQKLSEISTAPPEKADRPLNSDCRQLVVGLSHEMRAGIVQFNNFYKILVEFGPFLKLPNQDILYAAADMGRRNQFALTQKTMAALAMIHGPETPTHKQDAPRPSAA